MSATITGVGRLGKEPKMSFTPKGTAKTYVVLAVDSGFGDNKKTTWIGIWYIGQTAELVNKYFSKGARMQFSAEVDGIYAYQAKDETLGGQLNAKGFLAGFVDKDSAGKKDVSPFDPKPAEDDNEYEPEDF